MKFRNILALAATTATLALAPIAHAEDDSDNNPIKNLGAPIATGVPFSSIVYSGNGVYAITANDSIATNYVPEDDYFYLGDNAGHVYQCHTQPASTAAASITCDAYSSKK